MMAGVCVSAVTSYKDQVHPVKVTKQIERGMLGYNFYLEASSRCFSPLIGDGGRRCIILHKGHELLLQAKNRQRLNISCLVKASFIPSQSSKDSGNVYQKAKICSESCELETRSCERQLQALDSYFGKLQDEKYDQLRSCRTVREPEVEASSELEGKMTEMFDSIGRYIMAGLGSLEKYLSKLSTGINTKNSASPTSNEVSKTNSEKLPKRMIGEYHDREEIAAESNYKHVKSAENGRGSAQFSDENIHGLSTYDETSDFYIVSFLAALNIAVFLFEIASPIKSSDVEQLSLPLIYGGKINKLILVGEWWRLLTPMFLHSGFLHVALSSWVLLTFGPQVSRGYGPFTFFVIYALGGISGNLISFIHTPELTVCGTGPVFAIVGAWLVYQVQNKEVIPKEVYESMFSKAVIATALSFVLSNFGRIDDWAHIGAALSGVFVGYLTCPTLELDDASAKNGRREGAALIRQGTHLYKPLIIFITLSILIVGFLVFDYEGARLEMLDVIP